VSIVDMRIEHSCGTTHCGRREAQTVEAGGEPFSEGVAVYRFD
jgi:hypothetical protein